MKLAERFVNEKPSRDSWLFYLWGHSYEFDINHNWNVIEEFAAFTGNHDDIWYATNIEIYDYVQAYKQLQFSVEGTFVYNPTVTEICFEYNGMMYNIAGGEMKELTL